MQDRVQLRHFQQSWANATIDAVGAGRKVVVANVHPGSGKTLAVLHAANDLFRRGAIDSVQVFVPRVNLCQQFELDWKHASALYAEPHMGAIVHRSDEPLIRGGAFGYVSTYAALIAAERDQPANRHLRAGQGRRMLLVLDEAQQLGIDSDGMTTRSAEIVAGLAENSALVFVLSGTPKRADGRRLLLADYTDPDEKGLIYLRADVEATYRQGVAQGYLRPFEFQLCDGRAIHTYFDGEIEELQLSRMKSGLYRVLESEQFWAPMVDLWVAKVREYQRIEHRFCGLVGAISQAQAERIVSYLKRRHAGFRSLIAISDEMESQDNLRSFKKGGYDGLITVAMAHVGYDHKPIAVVLALTDVRESGWLDQFFSRALRVMPEAPVTMLALVPDDPPMAQYVQRKREESREGLKERERLDREWGGDRQPPRLGFTTDVEMGQRRAQGLEEDTELNPAQLAHVEGLQQQYQLQTVAPTALSRFMREQGIRIGPFEAAPAPPSMKTQREREHDIRGEINKITRRCDHLMEKVDSAWRKGWSNAELKRQFGKEISQCSQAELAQRLQWLTEIFLPLCRAKAREAGGEQ